MIKKYLKANEPFYNCGKVFFRDAPRLATPFSKSDSIAIERLYCHLDHVILDYITRLRRRQHGF